MTYSSSISTNKRQFESRHRNAVSFREQARVLGPITNTVLLLVLGCLLGLFYLSQVTKVNANGYKIDSLKKEYSSLQKEHDGLELSAAKLQSFDRVANSEEANKLVAITPTKTIR
ncbi:hypothetical protein A3F37_02925 [Candidatus Saccharibacteria bacterium RIFCSPHIGHO2_12_FULL_41_12]|nr:MAG: hypothetical protein A3F37_02925 [Candidatus Saccharibacteria bacterium RIFCSPHIGHO2_12_FULL_41_12]